MNCILLDNHRVEIKFVKSPHTAPLLTLYVLLRCTHSLLSHAVPLEHLGLVYDPLEAESGEVDGLVLALQQQLRHRPAHSRALDTRTVTIRQSQHYR